MAMVSVYVTAELRQRMKDLDEAVAEREDGIYKINWSKVVQDAITEVLEKHEVKKKRKVPPNLP